MKRSPLKRTTPLRNTKPLARKTRMRKVRHDRIRARRAVAFGKQAELCRRTRCCVPQCRETDCEPHHEPTRARGGLDADTCPLCFKHHHERHWLGRITFESRYGISLLQETARMRGLVALGIHDERAA